MSTQVGVAAPNQASADAALAVAAQGGTAVDAAVAAMLTATVTEPGIVSLAGGAYVTVWPAGAGAEAVTVDGHVAMPGLGRPDGAATEGPVDVRRVWTDYGGGVEMTVGLGTVATPGALAALAAAQQRYGALPWREVVLPAAAAARDGFPMGTASGYYLPYVRDTVFGWDPQTTGVLRGADGGWLVPGDIVRMPELADTLTLVAERGARWMYEGELADAIVADMTARGGLVTHEDLAGYEPVLRPALGWRTGGWQLRTNPPPSIGGPVLAALLTLLGDRPEGRWELADVAVLVAVQRWVLDRRRDVLDVADDREAAAGALLAEVAAAAGRGAPSTVHVSVVDDGGTACAVTSSSGYGSGATVPGTGLWLNNSLGEQELNRGAPPAPGSRLASNMAPTVGRSDDGAVLAIGSPGADRITTALAQVLAAFGNGGSTLQQAIDRPRLHVHHLDPPTDPVVLATPAGAPGTGDELVRVEAEEDMPLPTLDLPVRRHEPLSMYFGGVSAVQLTATGELEAAGDPRRAGVTRVSPRR